jgi:hypothetical protein
MGEGWEESVFLGLNARFGDIAAHNIVGTWELLFQQL